MTAAYDPRPEWTREDRASHILAHDLTPVSLVKPYRTTVPTNFVAGEPIEFFDVGTGEWETGEFDRVSANDLIWVRPTMRRMPPSIAVVLPREIRRYR